MRQAEAIVFMGLQGLGGGRGRAGIAGGQKCHALRLLLLLLLLEELGL